MTRETLLRTIEEYHEAGNEIYGYYVTYRFGSSGKPQRWGRIEGFMDTLDEMESSPECSGGELPVERLIIYSGEGRHCQCLVFSRNPLWDSVEGNTEDSHVMMVVPYIAEDGWFGEIVSERE